MADKSGYPQIPARVWWGVRELIKKSPSTRFDDANLAATLEVQQTAAKQYLAEFKRIGILDDDGSPTDMGKKWRLDDNYEAAVKEILTKNYPDGLISIAEPGEADRSKVKNWFEISGLGSGSANNKAATYVMIANDRPGEQIVRSPSKKMTGKETAQKREPSKKKVAPVKAKKSISENPEKEVSGIPLNVNVQVHISAEASPEQIDTIFSSMRKHLYDADN